MIAAPRLMLHAATLGFLHPITGARLRFESTVAAEITAWIARHR